MRDPPVNTFVRHPPFSSTVKPLATSFRADELASPVKAEVEAIRAQ